MALITQWKMQNSYEQFGKYALIFNSRKHHCLSVMWIFWKNSEPSESLKNKIYVLKCSVEWKKWEFMKCPKLVSLLLC